MVTAGISGQQAIQLVQAGVAGILNKHRSTEALCDAIRQVAAGEVCMEKDYLGSLFRSVDQTRPQTQPRLTDGDKTVLRFIFHGLTNKDIAAPVGDFRRSREGLSPATVCQARRPDARAIGQGRNVAV